MNDNPLSIGISTTVLREHPVAYALDQIARAGYTSAEVWPWHLAQTGEDPRLLARQAKDLGLVLTFHAFIEVANPLATDPQEAAEARKKIHADLKLAEVLNATVVTIHPGPRAGDEDSAEAAWGRLVDWVWRLDELAAQRGLQIGIELMEKLPLEIFMTPPHAARLMAHPFQQVGLTIDIAHMNTHGDPVAFLRQLDPVWIAHVHLSDNAPRRVHLPLGEGDMDLSVVLAALAEIYQGMVSIEGSVPGHGEQLLARNMAFLQKLGFG